MTAKHKSSWLWAVLLLTGAGDSGRGASLAPAGDIRRDATVMAIEQAMPSVVNIATTKVDEYRDPYLDYQLRFFGKRAPLQRREEPVGVGSGVIIDEDGYLLTNLHVLEGADTVRVKLSNGEVFQTRGVVGTPQKDVVLLQIIAPAGKKFQAMKFAPDDDLLLGETVIALGNPYGLGGSVTRGILSSKNRRPSAGGEQLDIPDWLQTDADINPGNSGGPLINLRGEMIGINAAVYREGQGMGVGFAIPVKQITAALADFFTPEASAGYWLGARVGSFNPPLTLSEVQPGSPAEKAGLRKGQRVLAVNGQSPRSLVDFHRLVLGDEKDLTVTFQVETNGGRRAITVSMIPVRELVKQKFGMSVRDLTTQEAAAIHAKPGYAVIIEQVEKSSPAEKAKLQPGFLLTAVDDRKAGDLLRSVDMLATKKAGDRVRLSFLVPRSFGTSAGDYSATLTVR